MSNSPLISYTKLSPNHSGPRRYPIQGVAIHTMAGNMSVESAGAWFAKPSTKASCNYAIDGDGRIALIVDEKNRSWCTSSAAVDNRVITIEVASTTRREPFECTPAAYDALIDLLVDICQRNNIPQLLWHADINLMGQYDKQNMVVHRWTTIHTTHKSCPGTFLYEHHYDIAAKVNARLAADQEDNMTKDQILTELDDAFIKDYSELPAWAAEIKPLLDLQLVNGGTSYSQNPTDINMYLSDIKTVLICRRMIEQATGTKI